jgi:DNA polymerase elongation subunit (family B)
MKFYTNVFSFGNKILYRERDERGSYNNEVYFKPSLFVNTDKDTKYKSIYGKTLDRVQFENKNDYMQFIEKYSDVNGFEIHGEIQAEYQFIRNHYGDVTPKYELLDIAFIDIETTCDKGFPKIDNPEEKIIAITISRKGEEPVVYCLGEYKAQGKETVHCFDNEENLLYKFLEYYSSRCPDIITGWSVRFFDIPYMYNRIKFVLGEKHAKKLSPWNIVREKIINRTGMPTGREEKVYDLIGVSTLDYYELYKTFTYTNRESYKLDYIAYIHLGERKLAYTEYNSIQEFYQKNFQKFIEYNIQDVKLVEKLDDKLKLMKLAVSLAYSAGVNFNDVFSQVKTWDVIIYNHLAKQNIIIPAKKKSRKDEQYVGAYVKEPLVGMHNWVVSFDLNSLYPHLIMQYNISPETLTADGMRGTVSPEGVMSNGPVTTKCLEENKSKNLSTAANGTTYIKNHRGFLAELMDKMYKDRKMFKNKSNDCKKQLEAVKAEMKRRGIS